MNKEVMKHCEAALLEAFPRGATGDVFYHWNKARQAIEQAEKQEQGEPVATLIEHHAFTDGIVRFDGVENMEQLPVGTKLYTKPQKRTWIGLLDDEKEHIEISGGKADLTLAEKIEAILKERNT